MSRISGLNDHDTVIARQMAVQAAFLALHHRDEIHYSQDPSLRWSGISQHKKAWRGQYPNYADCSSFDTWCLWNGLDHFHRPDIVNGEKWQRGYTGTMLQHGRVIPSISKALPGDAIIYGSGWPGQHTAVYVGNGRVISHGSEGGPYLLGYNYRRDILSIRRYI